MIIMKDKNPTNTIYYISGCILKEIIDKKQDVDTLFQNMKKYINNLEYKDFILSLDFLYLIKKIDFKKGCIKYENS